MISFVDVNCPYCGCTGKKPLSEFNRNKRLGRENFCSRTCAGKSNIGRVKETKSCADCEKVFIPSSGHLFCPSCRAIKSKKLCPICNTILIQARSKSCHSCTSKNRPKKERNDSFYMNEVYRRVKLRCRTNERLSFDIDTEYLLNIWNNQNGKCAYTSIELTLPTVEKGNHIKTASLDRIDSSKGYVKGNVQFVSMSINYMKNSMSHIETLQLIELIRNVGNKCQLN